MPSDHVAEATVRISAPAARVWDALVNPETIKRYMFGTTVVSQWKEGAPIVWKGEWNGKAYEDKGVILDLEPQRRLRYTHFSPLAGVPDTPKNYHTVTIELSAEADGVHLVLSQDNNPSDEARRHSERNWKAMLASLKELLEN